MASDGFSGECGILMTWSDGQLERGGNDYILGGGVCAVAVWRRKCALLG